MQPSVQTLDFITSKSSIIVSLCGTEDRMQRSFEFFFSFLFGMVVVYGGGRGGSFTHITSS